VFIADDSLLVRPDLAILDIGMPGGGNSQARRPSQKLSRSVELERVL
jgi:hypothetical protein